MFFTSIPSISAWMRAGVTATEDASEELHDPPRGLAAARLARHRRKGPRDQPLHAQPEATILPDQHLQLLPIPTHKNETVTRVRLVAQLVFDHARQSIDTPSHILRRTRHKDPTRRREVQHRSPRPRRHANAVDSTAAANSAGTPAVKTQRTPLRDVIDTSRRRRRTWRCGGRTMISTKAACILPSSTIHPTTSGGGRTDTLHVHAPWNPAFHSAGLRIMKREQGQTSIVKPGRFAAFCTSNQNSVRGGFYPQIDTPGKTRNPRFSPWVSIGDLDGT